MLGSSYQALNTTMIMSATDPQYYGRVMSVNLTTSALSPMGTFAMGFVIDAIGTVDKGAFHLHGVQAAYVGAGILVVLFVLLVTVFNPSYRRLELNDLRAIAHSGGEGADQPARERAATV